MCIPHADTSAQAPIQVPSMQAANALDIGGAPRGAAELGRLKLRLGGVSAAGVQDPAKAPTVSSSAGLPTTAAPDPASYASGSFALAPNPGLRLPA